ncbi:tetratricopeptide repeat protein [Porphyromonas catoniae ATCC 51270]|uniref:Tetratricopeptide repeat protein n=1 Tax=Porphyromonas catoniae ATCC 51270 TaxID=887901 RepID=Z4WVD6_9PORP|nr:tetratricopeptide repeat protein [Porphyromonas catoniae ATCC 51270]
MRKLKFLILSLLLGSSVASAQIDVQQVLSIGRNAIYFNDYIVSMGYFNQVIGLRPWMAEPYFYRSVAKINLDDYRGAEEDATLALERNPFLSRAYLVRGIARFSQKAYEPSISDFQHGLSLAPSDVGLRYNLAIAFLEAKRYEEADSTARTLLRFSPRNKDAYRLIAQAALERKDTIQAQQQIAELLRRDSTYSPAYLLQAQIAADRKDYPTATKAIDKVIQLEGGNASLFVNRAILRYHQNDFQGAMEDYTEAITLEPTNIPARNNRALLRSQVGEYSRAVKDWDEVISREPKNYIARYNRALLHIRLGNPRAALQDLNLVLDQYPIFSEGFLARAEARRMIGDIKGAGRDQIHVFDLQNNKQYRSAAAKASKEKAKSKATRSKEDEAIEKYNMLVETAPKADAEKPKYTSQVRGRVQDRDTQAVPKADLSLTYFTEVDKNGNQSRVFFSPLLDRYNALQRQSDKRAPRILLQERTIALSHEQIKALEQDIVHLSKTDQETATLYLRRGINYALLQDLDQAILDFTRAIKLAPQHPLAYFARASATMRRSEAEQGRLPEEHSAQETMIIRSAATGGKAVTTQPSTAPLVRPTRLSEQPPLIDLNQAIALDPQFAYAYYNRANLYVRSGEEDKALLDYTKAIELSPSFAEAYYNRGLLFFALGKVNEGTRDLSKAGELGLYEAYSLIKRMNK